LNYIKDSFGLIENINIVTLKLTLKVIDLIILPEYKGSSFRGVLGWQLKKAICANKTVSECRDCILNSQCLYTYLFSSQLPQDAQILRNTSAIPSPIIIEPPLTKQQIFEAGETMEAGLILIGKGIEYLPYIIYVFSEIGRAGIGKGTDKNAKGGHFELTKVEDKIGGSKIYNAKDTTLHNTYKTFNWQNALKEARDYAGDTLKIEFITPTRLKERKGTKNRLANLSSFGQLISHIFWRLLILSYFHCNPTNLGDERFTELQHEAGVMKKELAEDNKNIATLTNDTYWKEYNRWSNRQKTKMKMGGFMGTSTFSGGISPYLPLIYLGKHTHIGKQTMFGMGKYDITE